MRYATAILLALVFAVTASAQASQDGYRQTNERIIRQVFGGYGSQAVRVASCESGLSTWAHNGQYLGLFQMGYYARAKYGHANDAWTQSRAAYRYFRDSGRDWSPWSCKPW